MANLNQMKKELGEKFRLARTQKRLTIGEVAKAVGISPRSYSDYERGKRSPSYVVALAILRFLGVGEEGTSVTKKPPRLSEEERSKATEDSFRYSAIAQRVLPDPPRAFKMASPTSEHFETGKAGITFYINDQPVMFVELVPQSLGIARIDIDAKPESDEEGKKTE